MNGPIDDALASLQAASAPMVPVFDRTVAHLAHPLKFPSPAINRLMTLCWRAINRGVVRVGVMGGIPRIHFLGTSRVPGGGAPLTPTEAVLCLPVDWLGQLAADPYTTLGGLVWACSQACDWTQDKFLAHRSDLPSMLKQEVRVAHRAAAWEAEFYNAVVLHPGVVRAVAGTVPPFRPEGYTGDVLARYPRGLASLPDGLAYDIKPLKGYARDFVLLDRGRSACN